MEFISTDPLGTLGEISELKIWEKIKEAFAKREGYAYWRYPLFSEVPGQVGKYREPDILIVDKELGLIIIEVKGCYFNQIKQINGLLWSMTENFYTNQMYPVSQANKQMDDLLRYCDKQLELQDKVTSRILIGLPRIEREKWEAKFSNLPAAPPVICSNDLGAATLLKIIRNTPSIRPGGSLNDQQWKLLLGVVAGHSNDKYVWVQDNNTLLEVSHRKGVLDKVESTLFEMDILQEQLGKQIPPGPQRIRGIAGSGKTVILAQRAAHLHLKYPEWNIAFIFFTRSLYDQVRREVDRWLQRFSNERVTLEDAKNKIQILHAWGANEEEGFYSQFKKKLNLPSILDFQLKGSPTEKLAQLYCRILNHQPPIKPCYDAILIDEGQDLVVNEPLKFEERQPIYWLAWQTLRPTSSEKPHLRRLYWAYDEFQSLDALIVPEYKELFGRDLAEILIGRSAGVKYEGNILKSAVMRCCYRTPGNILVAAFALGTGLLRPRGRLSRFGKEDLKNNGFMMRGDLRSNNSLIQIWRNAENCKNPVSELWKKPSIEFQTFKDRQEEVYALVQKVIEAKNTGFKLDRHLMVICLGDKDKVQIQQKRIIEGLVQADISFFIPGSQGINQADFAENQNFFETKGNPSLFWMENAITLTGIHRAKGNEAFWVFISGLENIKEDNPQLRNQLFVAMTRTKGWLWISGLELEQQKTLYEEVRQAIQSNGRVEFRNRVDVEQL
ncbi:rfrA pentapeptide repeat-containing protein (plasmid) [Calothrix sp. NIES-4071]|nr:rfrA pentapeptide repeat-containing protein [Calothrix sp. NIES-4071]BAZ64642.1 rfrA pentapeptide repeat-containing protein [Calothrix sp. NIES-4105]